MITSSSSSARQSLHQSPMIVMPAATSPAGTPPLTMIPTSHAVGLSRALRLAAPPCVPRPIVGRTRGGRATVYYILRSTARIEQRTAWIVYCGVSSYSRILRRELVRSCSTRDGPETAASAARVGVGGRRGAVDRAPCRLSLQPLQRHAAKKLSAPDSAEIHHSEQKEEKIWCCAPACGA